MVKDNYLGFNINGSFNFSSNELFDSIPILPFIISLLKNNGEVVGATVLDYLKGEFIIINAKVVILATGHSNFLSLRSTGSQNRS